MYIIYSSITRNCHKIILNSKLYKELFGLPIVTHWPFALSSQPPIIIWGYAQKVSLCFGFTFLIFFCCILLKIYLKIKSGQIKQKNCVLTEHKQQKTPSPCGPDVS